jgi:hypothetical protein
MSAPTIGNPNSLEFDRIKYAQLFKVLFIYKYIKIIFFYFLKIIFDISILK